MSIVQASASASRVQASASRVQASALRVQASASKAQVSASDPLASLTSLIWIHSFSKNHKLTSLEENSVELFQFSTKKMKNYFGTRDLHGLDFGGPARYTSGPPRGPELSLGPGPFRPVACPNPARPGPTKAVSKGFLETIQYDSLKLFNTMMNFIKRCLFNEFVSYSYVTDASRCDILYTRTILIKADKT